MQTTTRSMPPRAAAPPQLSPRACAFTPLFSFVICFLSAFRCFITAFPPFTSVMSISSAAPGFATVSATVVNASSDSGTAHTSRTLSVFVDWRRVQSAPAAEEGTLLCDMSNAMRDGALATAGKMSSACGELGGWMGSMRAR